MLRHRGTGSERKVRLGTPGRPTTDATVAVSLAGLKLDPGRWDAYLQQSGPRTRMQSVDPGFSLDRLDAYALGRRTMSYRAYRTRNGFLAIKIAEAEPVADVRAVWFREGRFEVTGLLAYTGLGDDDQHHRARLFAEAQRRHRHRDCHGPRGAVPRRPVPVRRAGRHPRLRRGVGALPRSRRGRGADGPRRAARRRGGQAPPRPLSGDEDRRRSDQAELLARRPSPSRGGRGVRITFLVPSAYGMRGDIRATLNLAAALASGHHVEIVSVKRTRDTLFFPIDLAIRLRWLVDARPGRHLLPRGQVRTEVALWRALRALRSEVLITARPALSVQSARYAPREVVKIAREWTRPAVPTPVQRYYPRLDAVVTSTDTGRAEWTRLLDDELSVHMIPDPLPKGPWPRSRMDNRIVSAGAGGCPTRRSTG